MLLHDTYESARLSPRITKAFGGTKHILTRPEDFKCGTPVVCLRRAGQSLDSLLKSCCDS